MKIVREIPDIVFAVFGFFGLLGTIALLSIIRHVKLSAFCNRACLNPIQLLIGFDVNQSTAPEASCS